MRHSGVDVARDRRLTDLFDAHASDLYRFARRLARNQEDALDLVQDAFVRAAQAVERLPGEPAAQRAWLVRVALNLQKDRWRKQAVQRRFAASWVSHSERSPEAGYIDRSTVWSALDCLTPKRRAVVTLFELDGVSAKDIATLLGMSSVTVRWHLARGRKQLAQFIAGDRHEHQGAVESR